MLNFEKLEAWKKAGDFADLVSSATKTFPPEEKFGATNQLRRAVVSVSSNLAEGTARASKVDYARFVELASGSLFEVVSQSFIAKKQSDPNEKDLASIYSLAEELSRMLSGLRNDLLAS